MKIFFGNDHAGYPARDAVLAHLRAAGHDIVDLGWDSPESTDYPEQARAVAEAVAAEPGSRGVLVCGSGVGMSIAANKVRGARAALVLDAYSAEMSRRHNDANIICLRQREQDTSSNVDFLDTFLATAFEGGRHERRVKKIDGGC